MYAHMHFSVCKLQITAPFVRNLTEEYELKIRRWLGKSNFMLPWFGKDLKQMMLLLTYCCVFVKKRQLYCSF